MADSNNTTINAPYMTPTTSVNAEITEHSTIIWRAIFAGVFVALLTYMILLSLGLAIGGGNLQGVLSSGDSIQNLGIGAAIWMVLSILISLFAGSYAAGRVSGMITTRVGRIQGLVVSGLFFALLLSQIGNAIGFIGSGLGSTVSGVSGAIGDVAGNSQVQQVVDDAIGDLNMRSSPEVVITGVASRMINGNPQSAMNYLSRQTGISQAEAQTRIQSLQASVTRVANDVGVAAAQAMKAAGWTLFGALLLGSIVAMLGGGVGAQANLRKPLSGSDRKALRHARPATV